MSAQVTKLESQIVQLTTDNTDLVTKNNEISQSEIRLAAHIKELENETTQLNEERLNAMKENISLGNEVKSLLAQCKDLDESATKTSKASKAMEEKVKQLEKSEREISKAHTKVQAERNTFEQKMNEAIQQAKIAKTQIEERDGECQQLGLQIVQTEEKHQNLQLELVNAREAHTAAQNDCEVYKQQAAMMQNTINTLENQLKESSKRSTEAVEEVVNERNASVKANIELTKEHSKLQRLNKFLENRIKEIELKASESIGLAEKEHLVQKDCINSLEQKNTILKQDIKGLQTACETLDQAVTSARNMEEAHQKSFELEMSKLSSENKSIKQQYDDIKQQYDDIKQQYDELSLNTTATSEGVLADSDRQAYEERELQGRELCGALEQKVAEFEQLLTHFREHTSESLRPTESKADAVNMFITRRSRGTSTTAAFMGTEKSQRTTRRNTNRKGRNLSLQEELHKEEQVDDEIENEVTLTHSTPGKLEDYPMTVAADTISEKVALLPESAEDNLHRSHIKVFHEVILDSPTKEIIELISPAKQDEVKPITKSGGRKLVVSKRTAVSKPKRKVLQIKQANNLVDTVSSKEGLKPKTVVAKFMSQEENVQEVEGDIWDIPPSPVKKKQKRAPRKKKVTIMAPNEELEPKQQNKTINHKDNYQEPEQPQNEQQEQQQCETNFQLQNTNKPLADTSIPTQAFQSGETHSRNQDLDQDHLDLDAAAAAALEAADARPRRSRTKSVCSYALPSLRTKMRRQGNSTDETMVQKGTGKQTGKQGAKNDHHGRQTNEEKEEPVPVVVKGKKRKRTIAAETQAQLQGEDSDEQDVGGQSDDDDDDDYEEKVDADRYTGSYQGDQVQVNALQQQGVSA